MINPTHLRRHVIRPVLHHLGLWSESAERLLLGTAATESVVRGDQCLVQIGGGPARGIYQMEPATHRDIWVNWLRAGSRTQLRRAVLEIATMDPQHMVLDSTIDRLADRLVTDLAYATAMTRLHYRRVPTPLPAADDLPGLAEYWKRHYNTHLGAGRPDHFVRAVLDLNGR